MIAKIKKLKRTKKVKKNTMLFFLTFYSDCPVQPITCEKNKVFQHLESKSLYSVFEPFIFNERNKIKVNKEINNQDYDYD